VLVTVGKHALAITGIINMIICRIPLFDKGLGTSLVLLFAGDEVVVASLHYKVYYLLT
jgi:hypothetical protein